MDTLQWMQRNKIYLKSRARNMKKFNKPFSGRTSIDMIHGPLLGKILLFSLPLIASNILQLLFNAADVVVVGRFAGYDSLAAVGSTSSVVYLVTNLLIGLSVGVNVLVAQYLGQGQKEKEISNVLHTAVWVALFGGTALGLVGVAACRWILTMMATPSDIFDLTAIYLRIYFLGSPFVMLYNYGAAALRAIGDTRRPLFYLLISGIVNLGLNIVFVVAFQWDVVGVAIATIFGQFLSAALVLRCLAKTEGALHFAWNMVAVDVQSLKKIAKIGIPAGIQSCLFSLSNVVIQSAINSYTSIIIASCSAGMNIESFIYTSMNAYHHTAQTFISQNVGAGQYNRIRPIVRICLACTIVLGLAESALIVGFAPEVIGIYNTDPGVMAEGAIRLQIVASFYVIFGMADVLIGAIRGAGRPIIPVIINLVGTCLFRVVWIALLDTSQYGVEYVYISYPISWVLVLSASALYWWRMQKNLNQDTLKVN